jgi:ribosomal-protein-alanine N-acetyltransferase
MIISSRTLTRSATTKDLPKLANLIHFEAYVHRHLDYRPPLDWVGNEPFLILEEDDKIKAALACPPDPPFVAWIRLFAVSAQISPSYAWQILWEDALAKIKDDPAIKYITAIPLYSWFESLLINNKFELAQEIVMLNRETSNLPAKPPELVAIRPMTLDDLPAVHAIDEASFSPVWVNSTSYLEIAFRQAVVATVAEIDGRHAGYQISTSTPIGGHLARLAVLPDLQGRGIGYALLYDLIHQLIRRGARVITVNTQKDNQASLNLYKRTGFELTGEQYPIYQLAAF